MKKNLNVLMSILTIVYCLTASGNGLDDTLTVVNGFVYEVEEINPLENVAVRWYQFDSLGNVIGNDSVYTDAEGKFSDTLTEGEYSFYPELEFYREQTYHRRLELSDSLYNFSFIMYRPRISVSDDSLVLELSWDEPVQHQLYIQNEGSGLLSYSCALYLREEIPEDLLLINEGGNIGELHEVYYGPPLEENWKLLVSDDEDMETDQHDIKSVWTQVIDGTFYIKADFYDEITSFSDFHLEFWLDIDPAPNTGHPSAGYEYLLFIGDYNGMLIAPLLDYADGNYFNICDPVFADMYTGNDYIIAGYPLVYLARYDIILSRAQVRNGVEEYTYTDYAPDWGSGYNILFSVKSNASININKHYGEADTENSDTLTLTIQPEIINDTLDNFFIAFYGNDLETPISIIPVQLQKPAVIESNEQNEIISDNWFYAQPNPVVNYTSIHYTLDKRSIINLNIYNAEGKLVQTLFENMQPAGKYMVNWDCADNSGNRVLPGIYFCNLNINGKCYQKRLLIIH